MDLLKQFTDFDHNYNIIIGGYGLQNDEATSEKSLKFAKFEITHTSDQFENNCYLYESEHSMSCGGDYNSSDFHSEFAI